jgi:hypothetical protein
MGAAYRPRQCPANSLIHALRSNPVCTLRMYPYVPRLCQAYSHICALRSYSDYALRKDRACALRTVPASALCTVLYTACV